MRQLLPSAAAIVTCAFLAACTSSDAMAPAAADPQAAMALPGGDYQKVSDLVALRIRAT